MKGKQFPRSKWFGRSASQPSHSLVHNLPQNSSEFGSIESCTAQEQCDSVRYRQTAENVKERKSKVAKDIEMNRASDCAS